MRSVGAFFNKKTTMRFKLYSDKEPADAIANHMEMSGRSDACFSCRWPIPI